MSSLCWRRSLSVGWCILRFVNCLSVNSYHSYSQVGVLRGLKKIQRVYLYNDKHAPRLPTSEVKMLLLQSESTMKTFGESPHTETADRTIDIWKVRGRVTITCVHIHILTIQVYWTYDSDLDQPRRGVVQCTQKAFPSMVFR
jgi:hypothetical protein